MSSKKAKSNMKPFPKRVNLLSAIPTTQRFAGFCIRVVPASVISLCVCILFLISWDYGSQCLTIHSDTGQSVSTPEMHSNAPQGNAAKLETMLPSKGAAIDMITIGSHSRPMYPLVQQSTFGSHHSIRNFWAFDENDDEDQMCQQMTIETVKDIANLCRSPSTYARIPLMRKHFAPQKWLLERTKNPSGWLCAQKRPLTALFRVLHGEYKDKSLTIPDYLFVMDDDSWFHLELMIPILYKIYPPNTPRLVTGCLIRSPKDDRFAFYWGGFGVILTRKVIQRLLIPLTCHVGVSNDWSIHRNEPHVPFHDTGDFATNDHFVQYACHRIALNLIGEQHFYKTNMTLMELIYQYSAQQPYSLVEKWLVNATFCMHSDITLSYFWQYYRVARHANDSGYANVDYNRIEGYQGSTKIMVSKREAKPPIYKSQGQCLHLSNQDCTEESHLCHYVTAKHMQELSARIVNKAPPGVYKHVASVPEIEVDNNVQKHPDAHKIRKEKAAIGRSND